MQMSARNTIAPETVSKDEYRQAMSRLAAAVCVVTTDGPAGRAGSTVSAVSSVTDEPATLLVCLNRSSRTNGVVRGNGALCVNVLAAGVRNVADVFSGAAGVAAEERFQHAAFATGSSGAPMLEAAIVSFDCVVDHQVEVGTHTVFFARVVGLAGNGATDCLGYFSRRYTSITAG